MAGPRPFFGEKLKFLKKLIKSLYFFKIPFALSSLVAYDIDLFCISGMFGQPEGCFRATPIFSKNLHWIFFQNSFASDNSLYYDPEKCSMHLQSA